MDFYKLVYKLKPVKGKRLVQWLKKFLVISPGELSEWRGTFMESVTAKAVEVLRRRGVIEVKELDQSEFSRLVNACYRTSIKRE